MDKKRKRRPNSKCQITKQNRQKANPDKDNSSVNPINEDLVVTLLTRTPTILEKIFKLLNLRELQKCSLVCKMWNQLAEIVKNQRRNPLVIYEVAVDEEGQPINVMHEYNVRRLGDIERIQYRYQLKWGSKRLLAKFEERLKNTYVDPGFGFVFCCNLRYELRYRNLNAILPHGLPPGVSLLRAYGKVSIGLPDSTRLNWPLEAERVPAISAIFFPKNMSGVEFYPFVIPKSFNTISSLPTKRRKQSKEYDNATRIPRGKKIKCLMIFKRNPYIYGKEEETIPITQYLMSKENYKLALGGLEADNIQMQNTPSRPVGLNDDETGVGLAITGEKVEAASILIQPSMRTKEAVIAKLKELRDGISLKSKTVGFLFSSRHKGIEHYQVPDVESSAFQCIFPKIPLVGMTGNAIDRPGLVIGTEYFPNVSNADNESSNSETERKFEHVRSSVFVLLTWG